MGPAGDGPFALARADHRGDDEFRLGPLRLFFPLAAGLEPSDHIRVLADFARGDENLRRFDALIHEDAANHRLTRGVAALAGLQRLRRGALHPETLPVLPGRRARFDSFRLAEIKARLRNELEGEPVQRP